MVEGTSEGSGIDRLLVIEPEAYVPVFAEHNGAAPGRPRPPASIRSRRLRSIGSASIRPHVRRRSTRWSCRRGARVGPRCSPYQRRSRARHLQPAWYRSAVNRVTGRPAPRAGALLYWVLAASAVSGVQFLALAHSSPSCFVTRAPSPPAGGRSAPLVRLSRGEELWLTRADQHDTWRHSSRWRRARSCSRTRSASQRR